MDLLVETVPDFQQDSLVVGCAIVSSTCPLSAHSQTSGPLVGQVDTDVAPL